MTKMLKIDLNMWQTPTERAKEKGYSTQYISTLIRQGKIKFWKIEELNIVLVKRDAGTKVAAAGVPLPKDFVPFQEKRDLIKKIAAKPIRKAPPVSDYLKSRRSKKLGMK